MNTRKYLGHHASIAATSIDGLRWQLELFEHGRRTKLAGVTTLALEKLAADRGMTQQAR